MKKISIGSGLLFAGMKLPFSKKLFATQEQPNFLFIITDQERHTQYFPEGWEQTNLPNLTKLKSNGITFNNAFCNSCMCSPSRATFLTGLYPAQHSVTATLPECEGEANTQAETELNPDIPNIAHMLNAAGYNVIYKGKWHASKPQGEEWTFNDLSVYGFKDWQPPDVGEDLAPENYGGGRANNDQRIAEDATAFLQNIDISQPFALFVSLVNPHDVSAYPDNYNEDYGQDMLIGDIETPPTIDENLENNYKPKAQVELLNKLKIGIGALPTVLHKKRYVNFYGNLLKLVDNEIGKVLDVLSASRDGHEPLVNSTFVFRFSDHGEMGLSHGGLRQKMFVSYEEAIRVPLIVSNPVKFPTAVTSDALVSLIDIMPTIASLINLPDRHQWNFKGVDFSPIIENPSVESVQNSILFTFDDVKAGMDNIDQLVDPPNRIRCIREKEWKFARYFDIDGNIAPEYEMYDLDNDPQELENLAHPSHPQYNDAQVVLQRDRLKNELATTEEEKLSPIITKVSHTYYLQKNKTFQLYQNYPNPFNMNTRITFSLEKTSRINLTVFDVNGKKVETIINEIKNPGFCKASWSGCNDKGAKMPSGTYFYSLTADGMTETRRMILIK